MKNQVHKIIARFRSASEALPSETKKVKDTRAIREIKDATKFLKVPLIRQSTDYSCGAASFLSVLGYYGFDPYERQIMRIMKTTLGGTDPEGFEIAAKKFGLKIKTKEGMTYHELQKSIEEEIPVILAIQAWGDKENYSKEWGEGHYVVTVGFDKDGFFLMDPSQIGYSYITRKNLDHRWHDLMKDSSKKFVRLGIMVYGKDPKFDYNRVRPIE